MSPLMAVLLLFFFFGPESSTFAHSFDQMGREEDSACTITLKIHLLEVKTPGGVHKTQRGAAKDASGVGGQVSLILWVNKCLHFRMFKTLAC